MRRQLIITLLIIALVAGVFWTQSRYPSLQAKASGESTIQDALSFGTLIDVPSAAPLWKAIPLSTINWVNTNLHGMSFGIVFGALLLSLLQVFSFSRGKGRFGQSFEGGLMGIPLGVCVNCATPIAQGLKSGGASTPMAISTMLSSPSFNVIVLSMVFGLFPLHMALSKVLLSVSLVFLLVPLVTDPGEVTVKGRVFEDVLPWGQSCLAACKRIFWNLWFIVRVTVPLMLLAGFLGVVFVKLVPFELLAGIKFSWLWLSAFALIGTFLPVPIAFDVVMAHTLFSLGLSASLTMVLLFTMGVFSVYPFFVIYRNISKKLAVTMFLLVALLGGLAGTGVELYEQHQTGKVLELYSTSPFGAQIVSPREYPHPSSGNRSAPALSLVVNESGVALLRGPHEPRGPRSTPFAEIDAKEVGLAPLPNLSVLDMYEPFFYGRGLAAGDVDDNGLEDLLFASRGELILFRNQGGVFAQERLPLRDTFALALVDIDGNGWLDIVASVYGGEVYLMRNDGGSFGEPVLAAEVETSLAQALAFGDLDRDGDLDMVIGGWHFGIPLMGKVSKRSLNYIAINKGDSFTLAPLGEGMGETLSLLLSDLDEDSSLDLVVGNDFDYPDEWRDGPLLAQEEVLPANPRETMSIDSADVDNDLDLDVFMVGTSYPLEEGTGRDACQDITDVERRDLCLRSLRLEEVVATEDFSSCEGLGEHRKCLSMILMKMAVRKRDASLCDTIPSGSSPAQLCEAFFRPLSGKTPAVDKNQRSGSNVLLVRNGSELVPMDDSGLEKAYWGWNARFADVDNDGWQDVYVANGYWWSFVEPWQDRTDYPNMFFHNIGGHFEKAQVEFGLYNTDKTASYVWLDVDGDGDLDLITRSLFGDLRLFINTDQDPSLTVDLRMSGPNVFGVGSRVILEGEDFSQVREVKASGGFASFQGPLVHFGLGGAGNISSLRVVWPDGAVSRFDEGLESGQRYRVVRE